MINASRILKPFDLFFMMTVKNSRYFIMGIMAACILFFNAGTAFPWYDETHLAIAKAAGYKKWYLAAGADMAKVKAGHKERLNHFVSIPPETVVTPEMVKKQIRKYDKPGFSGRLYGAIVASVRDYLEVKKKGKYAEYHMAYCAHYVGDLSQPLHNTPYNDYNKKFHRRTDGLINHDVLDKYQEIVVYPIRISSEEDLIKEIVRIANLSLDKAHQIEAENRLLTPKEAYDQISHSASLFKGILDYVSSRAGTQNR